MASPAANYAKKKKRTLSLTTPSSKRSCSSLSTLSVPLEEALPSPPDPPSNASDAHKSVQSSSADPSYSLKIGQFRSSDPSDLRKTGQFRHDYSVGRFLGRGGQGSVFLCTHKHSGKKFACKSVYKSDLALFPDAEDNLKQEILTLSTLRDQPHVITLEAVYEDPFAFHLVTEFCEKGTLADRLRSKEDDFTEDDAARVFYDVLCTLMFLHHDCKIMHRDVKAENVFLKSDGTVKLGDFGYATSFRDDCILMDAVGSPLYMAPEMMMRQGYDERSEVWSLGVLLYTMMSGGELPFLGDCVDEIYEEIVRDEYPLEQLQISPSVQDLIRSMLCLDPDQRLTLEEVLQHPWLTS